MNMSRHAMCNSFIIVLLIIQSNCQVPDWFVKQKVTKYGESLTLFCPVENCCKEDSGWDLFNPSRKTLFIDVREVHKGFTPKYTPATSTSGFSLTINNLTRDDLNITYSCTYGFKEGTPKLLLEQNVFKNETDVTKATKVHIGQIVGYIVPAVAVILIIIIIIVLCRKRTLKNSKNMSWKEESVHTSQLIVDISSPEIGKADTKENSTCPSEEREGLLLKYNIDTSERDVINLNEVSRFKKSIPESNYYQDEQKTSELKSDVINLPSNSENYPDIVKTGEEDTSVVINVSGNSESHPNIIKAEPTNIVAPDDLSGPVTEDEKKNIERYYDEFVKEFCCEEIIDRLISERIIKINDREIMDNKPTQEDRNRELLRLIVGGSRRGFKIFLDALRTEKRYVDLANKIECYGEPVGEKDEETFEDWVKDRIPDGKGEIFLTDLHLLYFSKCVKANGMCQLGTFLDISKPEIENIEYKHFRSPSPAAHELLVKWRNRRGPKATVRSLLEQLFRAHKDAHDSIYEDEIWKAIQKL